MAGRIAGITIEIGGDSTKLQNSLKGVDKSLKQTQTALKDIDKLLKFNPGNTELLVQEGIKQLLHNRTSFVVAHRLSTIRHADLICVMHEGRIVERGTHDELYHLGGYYTKLVEMQQ